MSVSDDDNDGGRIAMMMLPQYLVLSLALAPSMVSAVLFPLDSLVNVVDHKGFKDAMK